MLTLSYREKFVACLIVAAWMNAVANPRSEPCGPLAPAHEATETDKKQILDVISRMQEACNRGDFRGYMQGFKNPDVIFVSGGRFQDGWQGTLDHYIRD
jgi:hypothetical protein